jgi:hypothetical protein
MLFQPDLGQVSMAANSRSVIADDQAKKVLTIWHGDI